MKDLGRAVLSPALAIAHLLKPKTPELPAPIPQATRDDARDQQTDADALRKRRGGAANILTSRAGAEAPAGAVGKDTLGS